MIEVIKHGKKKFTATCSNCGCEFTYEVEDIHDGKIICPDCHKEFPHIMTSGYISTTPDYYPPKTVWFNTITGADKDKFYHLF